jgi:hypothetical protein
MRTSDTEVLIAAPLVISGLKPLGIRTTFGTAKSRALPKDI